MKAETIIALITASVAFLTSVSSFTYNLIQNRKNRIQKIVLENRVKYMNEIRDGFASIISACNVQMICLAKNDSAIRKTCVEKMIYGYGKIKAYIKPFYAIDRELLTALDGLYDCILSALNGEEEKVQAIVGLRDDFADKYLKYDWAYWKYIQRQKGGNYMNSDDAFDKIYYEFTESIKKG